MTRIYFYPTLNIRVQTNTARFMRQYQVRLFPAEGRFIDCCSTTGFEGHVKSSQTKLIFIRKQKNTGNITLQQLTELKFLGILFII